MEAKEKAKELYGKFYGLHGCRKPVLNGWLQEDNRTDSMQTKTSVLICIDEQIQLLKELAVKFDNNSDESWWYIGECDNKIEFLEEVKSEIEKL